MIWTNPESGIGLITREKKSNYGGPLPSNQTGSLLRSADGRTMTKIRSGCPKSRFGYVTHHYGNWLLIDGSMVLGAPCPGRPKSQPALPSDLAGIREGLPG